ncbi:class I adenylate-forming enzyme family protein [Mycolicibacter sp. MYC123]|uniref:Class I adenylate-forming enzyme family protein n=1 Tax=[Mycobacterium] zoologicum TaxID=2872311 RepID=A0ABU5YPV9_9MYCO|nr:MULTISPECIES: class I adenylate-forming enzyme family protein [unclassified Mycolicibacter]MEB3052096.1 class I adenylate-forming enzyme family protein [Mycolicibacter sp. MYC123]MEB3062892.1 class I adenylate-forming enzyme family protein [Mycolicibacter sp. MYC101]
MIADTLPQIWRTKAGSQRPLLICDSERLSYAEADARSAALATQLISLGCGKGTHVGVLHPNGPEFVVAMLAAARIGAVVVPLPTIATAPELRGQLVHSDVRILLAAESYRSHDYRQRLAEVLTDAAVGDDPIYSVAVPQLRHVIFGYSAPEVDELLPALEDDVDPDDPLAIIYTSGSSGNPKGVVHTHAGLIGHQRYLNQVCGITSTDIHFSNSPFFWVGGFAFALLGTVLAGSTLLCSNATDPSETLDLLEAEKPTLANGFASGVAGLIHHPSLGTRDLSSVRRGNLYPIMAPDVRPEDPGLRHGMLGMTETGGPVLLSDDVTDQPEHRRGSFGKPAPGIECRVDDGELLIRGRHVMQRYHRRSREECFDADGWFHTGDQVRTDADGFYYFLGRRDAMIKTAGANVSPAEVERAIAKVTGGVTAHVIGIPDPDRGQVVAAVLVDAGPDPGALRELLRTELSAYKIPRRFISVAPGTVPLLASGKVDGRRLAALFAAVSNA